jgi:hypothetical protein
VSGSHDYLWPRQFLDIVSTPGVAPYRWSFSEARFTPWLGKKGPTSYAWNATSGVSNISTVPENVPIAAPGKWTAHK